MAPIKRPRGTRDFGPDEMDVRRRIEDSMRETLARFGYREVQTPVFERLELFTAKSGDAIKQELYAFEDKAGRELALRPEITAAVMRYFHNELTVAPRPLKLWYLANCFRYDRPQKGRYREFWQVGCEIIGSDEPEAHAELIALTTELLSGAGLKKLEVRIGHIAVLSGLLATTGVKQDDEHRGSLLRAIDKSDTKGIQETLGKMGIGEENQNALIALSEETDNHARREKTRQLLETGTGPEVENAQTALTELDESMKLLAAQSGATHARFDPLIARGLDYYTGLVFEIDAPLLGAEKQVAGGGGYDLSSVFDAERVPTTGFALGFDRVLVALEAEGNLGEPEPWLDVYVVPIGDEQREEALEITHLLRSAGLRVEMDLMRRAAGKNLKTASAHKARYAVMIGERERNQDVATVKDLDTGKQDEIPQRQLPSHLRLAIDEARKNA